MNKRLAAILALLVGLLVAGCGEDTKPGASSQARDQVEQSAERNLRDETPVNVSPETQREGIARNDQRAGTQPSTTGAPRQGGCGLKFVRNYSSREGVKPLLWVLHYTVSPNRTGWSDVDAIVAWFDNPRSQASSNYVIDNEGHCKLIVRESSKAWTQAYFNRWSISVEVINTGSESSYAGKAGLAKVAKVVSDSTKRNRIPLRRARTNGCTIVRSGVTDHDALGCGNTHTDIKPYSTSQVLAAAKRYRNRTAIRSTDRVRCRKIRWWRRAGRPHGLAEQRAVWRRKALAKRGLRCTASGVRRVG